MNLRTTFYSIATAAILAALTGCGGGGGGGAVRSGDDPFTPASPRIHTKAEAQLRAQWTVLVYLDADNDLEEQAINNFNQMEMVGSTKSVHVIVQMDRKAGDQVDNDSWTDTRRYLVINDSDTHKMNSIRLDNPALGELDMANPATLRNFVTWGMAEFPADHYLLVIWDHGTGWQLKSVASAPLYKYVAMDNTSSTQMDVTQIPGALAGLKPDVLAFDACYMQELEVAYQLAGSAGYMVGSSAAEPSPGYNYARILSKIPDGASASQLCRIIVQQYAAEYPNPRADITQSAIDLSKVGSLGASADAFAHMLDDQSATWGSSLNTARMNALDYSSTGVARYNVDMLDYAEKCSQAIGSGATTAHTNLVSAFNAAVIASVHNSDMANSHGLAVYVPSAVEYDSRYQQLLFAQSTWWDDWLKKQPR